MNQIKKLINFKGTAKFLENNTKKKNNPTVRPKTTRSISSHRNAIAKRKFEMLHKFTRKQNLKFAKSLKHLKHSTKKIKRSHT